MSKVIHHNEKMLFVLSKNTKTCFNSFKKKFKLIKAGGGIVFNNKHEILFIFRKGFWDLPKGKLDKGETIKECALREVKEECGIKKLKVGTCITKTYHIYTEKNKLILKETSWFSMKMQIKQKLVPQTEEGIIELKFVALADYINNISNKTYPLIRELINSLPENIY